MSRTLIYALCALVGSGCINAADRVLESQARIVMGTERVRLHTYRQTHEICLRSPTMNEYRECMEASRHVARLVDSYALTLVATQTTVRALGGDSFKRVAPCLVKAAVELADAMEAANVPVPPQVADVAAMIESFGGECSE